jgi:hypothetical protein
MDMDKSSPLRRMLLLHQQNFHGALTPLQLVTRATLYCISPTTEGAVTLVALEYVQVP